MSSVEQYYEVYGAIQLKADVNLDEVRQLFVDCGVKTKEFQPALHLHGDGSQAEFEYGWVICCTKLGRALLLYRETFHGFSNVKPQFEIEKGIQALIDQELVFGAWAEVTDDLDEDSITIRGDLKPDQTNLADFEEIEDQLGLFEGHQGQLQQVLEVHL